VARGEHDDCAAEERRGRVVGVAARHDRLCLEGRPQQVAGVERAAEERVRREGPATAEAALPPSPPARGSPFSTRNSSPAPGAPARRRTSAAARAAVFRAGSHGIRGSETDRTRIPASDERTASTRSPIPATAIPRQSNPGPTFDVDPGA